MRLAPTDERIVRSSLICRHDGWVRRRRARARAIRRRVAQHLREVGCPLVAEQRSGVGEHGALEADFPRHAEDRELQLGRPAEIGGASEAVAGEARGIADVARAHAARREAAHQRRSDIEVVGERQIAAADLVDLAALQMDEAGEVVGDRIIVFAVEGLAQELRLAAEAGDVLMEVGVDAARRILAVVDAVPDQ